MASTELSGIQAFTVYDPATGDRVQVDGKYVETFDFTQRRGGTNGPESPTGATVSGGDFSEVEVVFMDVAGKSLLETWATSDTPVSMVAAGEQAALQWYETDIITELEEQPVYDQHGDLNRLRLRIVREGHGIHDIHKNTNLLRTVNHQIGSTFLADSWQDSDTNEFPDGYNTFDLQSPDFAPSNNEFAAFGQTSAPSALEAQIKFPISGIDITHGSNVKRLHDDGDTKIRIAVRDFSGSAILTTEQTITSTGRKSQTETTPSETYKIKVQPLRTENVSAQNTKAKIGPPSLRLDGSDQFAEY